MTELRPDDLRSDFCDRTGEQALVEFSVSCSDTAFFKTQTIEMPAIEYMKHLEYMVLEANAKVADLEKENERLSGIVHNLDHALITNGVWSKV